MTDPERVSYSDSGRQRAYQRRDASLVAELASATGFSDTSIRGDQYGQRVPSVDRADCLAAAFDCPNPHVLDDEAGG
jgi:hypothetical protein